MVAKLLKPLSFIPALVLMYVIFSFSAQDGTVSSNLSYQVSYKIVEAGNTILDADLQPSEIASLAERFNGVVRKLAHMTEYFALAIAVSFPLYVYGLHGVPLMLTAGIFCVAFACGDEYHQSFVSGREPSVRDVLIDSFGVFWGIILVRIIGWIGRKTVFRPFAKKKKEPCPDEPVYTYQAAAGQNPSVYQSQPQYQNWQNRQNQAGYRNDPIYQNPQYSGQSVQQFPEFQNQQYTRNRQHSSDSLSEDLSLKKLLHDLKDPDKGEKK